MLRRYERLARQYRGWRIPIWLAFMVSAGFCGWLLLMASVSEQDRWLIPAVLVTLWLLLSGCSLLLFANVPGTGAHGTNFATRVIRRLYRLCFYILAWCMLLTTIALLVVSVQLLLAWYRQHF